MAQLNSLRKVNTAGTPTTPRGHVSPTFEQLLHGDTWASSPTTTPGKDHEHGEPDDHHNKKSVLAKVKETAKKVKHSLSKKKHGQEDTGSPSVGVTLEEEDEHEEDSEYLGAPMYESEMAPEPYRETARQHPRAIPVVSQKHVLLSSVNDEAEQEKEKPNKTITKTVSDKLGPAYAAVTDATYAIASKISGLTVATDAGDDSAADSGMMKLGKGSETRDKGSAADSGMIRGSETQDKGSAADSGMMKLGKGSETRDKGSAADSGMIKGSQTWDKGSAADSGMMKLGKGSETRDKGSAADSGMIKGSQTWDKGSAADSGMMKLGKGSETWDKGVSVKEYLMNKFEPGEDERALSHAITEAISPRRVTGDVGVVDKVKGAVNSLFHSDDSSSSLSATRATPLSPPVPVSTNPQQKKEAADFLLRNDESFASAPRAANLSPPIPLSTNPHQVTEEENHGRILQAN